MKNWKALIYGSPGIGVERLASLSPKPVYISTRDRLVSWAPSYDSVYSLVQLQDTIAACSGIDAETIILDNLSGVERLISDELIGRDLSLYELPYGVGEGRLKNGFRDILDRLRRIGKNIILLANQTQISVPGVSSLASFPCKAPDVHRCIYSMLDDWLDVMLNLDLDFEEGEKEIQVVRHLYGLGCPTRRAFWKPETKGMTCPLPVDGTVFGLLRD